MRSLMRRVLAVVVVAPAADGLDPLRRAGRSDAERSTLTVYVVQAGMFSAFADDHIVDAPIVSGTVSDGAALSVAIDARAACA